MTDLSNEAYREEWDNGYFHYLENTFEPPVGKLSRKRAYLEGWETAKRQMERDGDD